MMTPRVLSWILWTGSSLTVVSCLWLSFVLINAEQTAQRDLTRMTPTVATSPNKDNRTYSATFSEKEFQYVWKKRLQKSLVDPPPPPKEATKSEIAPALSQNIEIQLVATFVDSSATESRAWIVVSGNKRFLVKTDESLEDVPGKPVIEAITDRSITIRVGDKRIVREIGFGVERNVRYVSRR